MGERIAYPPGVYRRIRSPRSLPSTTRRGLLGLCRAGAVGLAGCGTIGRDCPGPSSAGAPTDRPHRYHDLGNSNAAPERQDSLSGQWTVRVETTLREPVIAEGTIYAVAVPRERPFDSRLLAYDADDGERLREVPMAGFYRARIAAVVDGTAYVVAAPLDNDERFRLYAVDTVVAADLGADEPIAARTFDDQLNRTPAYADGRAFAHTVEDDRSGDGVDHVADRIHALG